MRKNSFAFLLLWLSLNPVFADGGCQCPALAGPKFTIAASRGADLRSKAAVNTDTGDYLVVWLWSDAGINEAVVGRVFDFSGKKISKLLVFEKLGPWRRDFGEDGPVRLLAAYNSREKEYLVSWLVRSYGDWIKIKTQRVSASGEKLASSVAAIQISGSFDALLQGLQYSPHSGEYVILFFQWAIHTNPVQGVGGDSLILQRLNKEGLPVGGPIPTYGGQERATLVFDDILHRYMLSWISPRYNLVYRMFSSDLVPLTNTRLAMTGSEAGYMPQLTYHRATRQYVFFGNKDTDQDNALFVELFNQDGWLKGTRTIVRTPLKRRDVDLIAPNTTSGEIMLSIGLEEYNQYGGMKKDDWRMVRLKPDLSYLTEEISVSCGNENESPEDLVYNPRTGEYLLIKAVYTSDERSSDLFGVRIRGDAHGLCQ